MPSGARRMLQGECHHQEWIRGGIVASRNHPADFRLDAPVSQALRASISWVAMHQESTSFGERSWQSEHEPPRRPVLKDPGMCALPLSPGDSLSRGLGATLAHTTPPVGGDKRPSTRVDCLWVHRALDADANRTGEVAVTAPKALPAIAGIPTARASRRAYPHARSLPPDDLSIVR